MIDWISIKSAADFYTLGGTTGLFHIRPNMQEVAYLSKHPEYHDEHLERVINKLRELKANRLYEGYLKSMAVDPWERRYADRKLLERQMDVDKDTKRREEIDKKMAEWDTNDRDKIKQSYNKHLLKALAKFNKKYGPNSKKPYMGEGTKVKDTHTNLVYY